VAIRVTQLDETGAPAIGGAMYVTDNLTKIDFNPETEAGQDISTKKASGDLCVVWRTPDMIKRLNISLEMCVPDPEFEALVTGGELYFDQVAPTDVIGWAYPPLMVDSNPNGVSVEAWTRYVVDGIQPASQPYIWWTFPKQKLRNGNRTIDENPMANVYEGFATENPEWGTGPEGDWDLPSDRVVQAKFTDTVPIPQCGGQKVVVGPTQEAAAQSEPAPEPDAGVVAEPQVV
jgi:hypothetical protein